MSNFYKENADSQPGIGYYVQKETGGYEPVMRTEQETIILSDGTRKVIQISKKIAHWMHPSILTKKHPAPGVRRIIETHLVPAVINPVHDRFRRN